MNDLKELEEKVKKEEAELEKAKRDLAKAKKSKKKSSSRKSKKEKQREIEEFIKEVDLGKLAGRIPLKIDKETIINPAVLELFLKDKIEKKEHKRDIDALKLSKAKVLAALKKAKKDLEKDAENEKKKQAEKEAKREIAKQHLESLGIDLNILKDLLQ